MLKEVKYRSINLRTMPKFNKQFLIAYFKITSECMLNCPFCSQGNNPKRTINNEKAKKVLKKLKKLGVMAITYTGGEPLLFKDLNKLLEYGKELGFEQIIVTNGLLLSALDPQAYKYIDGIGVSLHGNKDIHDKIIGKKGIYKKIVENIDYVIKKYPNINMNINCTLTKDNCNYDNMKYLTDFAKKRNIRICFGRLNYIGLSKQKEIIDPNNYLLYIHKLKKEYHKLEVSNCISLCNQNEKYNYLNHSCGAGQTMIAIEANGDVKICASSNIVIGNILKDRLKKIVNNRKIQQFIDLKWLPMECGNCKKFALCKGGCHAENTGIFYKDNCDALLKERYDKIWNIIKQKKLKIKNIYVIKKSNNKYMIINRPVREVNKIGIKIIKQLNGKKTANEIEKDFFKVKNCREFLVLLQIDGMLE